MDKSVRQPLLNFQTAGDGYPVLLIHGLATSLNDWQSLIPELVEQGFATYAVDLFGHGDSPRPKATRLYTFKVVYGTLEEWIESLDINSPFFMIGHSMGGYMSLMYALRHPKQVRALALIDPLYSLRQLPPFMINTHRLSAIGAEMLRVVPGRIVDMALGRGPTSAEDFSPEIRRRLVADIKRASPYILNIPSTLPDLTPELGKITPPCQVVWGDRDAMLNPESFPRLVRALPFAVGHVMPDRGHQPHQANPAEVNRLLCEFLAMNLTPLEALETISPAEDARLAWRFLLAEKYQLWFHRTYVSRGRTVDEASVPPDPQRQLRADLLSHAERLIEGLLEWRAQTLSPTRAQVEAAAQELGQEFSLQALELLQEERLNLL